MRYRITEASSPPAGDIRALGYRDAITLHRSALRRSDWAAIAGATMTAFARGATINLVDDIEPKESS